MAEPTGEVSVTARAGFPASGGPGVGGESRVSRMREGEERGGAHKSRSTLEEEDNGCRCI